MFELPTLLPARGYETTSEAKLLPRFEDIAQSGAVQLHALVPGLGAIWHAKGSGDRLNAMRRTGVLPILRRMVAVGEPGPFSPNVPITTKATWRLARETGSDRILMGVWMEAHAPLGTMLDGPPPPDAPLVLVGRVYAEHVITRPFAPPAERKVVVLEIDGLPRVPEDAAVFEPAETLLRDDLTPARDVYFGAMHTDSNHHVNSLVYPRIVEERIVERLDGRPLLARRLDIRWRKPFFVGDRATVLLGLTPAPDGVSVIGALYPHGGPREKPSATIALHLTG